MFEILFENEDFIAVNKPEGLSSIPERQPGERNESLYEMLCAQRDEKLFIVHRIDKDTSGVIVFAKSAAAHRCLGGQFERRTVQKVYLALVHGTVDAEQGVIDKPLGPYGSGRIGVNPQRGRAAYTEYLVTHRYPGAPPREFGRGERAPTGETEPVGTRPLAYTLVEAYPKTGRRHQIRVHFYSIGHPIVGDRLYGNLPVQRTYPRMMLHAHRLTIRLSDRQLLTLETPPPESFEKVIQRINAS